MGAREDMLVLGSVPSKGDDKVRQLKSACFVPRGRTGYFIYAVTLREQPGITKVGRTKKWTSRRVEYANWNLAPADGIASERVFCITEEFVDLPKLEAHILGSLRYPLRHGTEWFVAEIEDVARDIDRVLCDSGLSYV